MPALPTAVSVVDWREALASIFGDGPTTERTVLKDSKTTHVFRTRIRLRSDPIDVVCKHVVLRGRLRRLVRGWGRSRAARTWERAMYLLRAGINTAQPLACLQRGEPTRETCVITRVIPDVTDLERILSGALHELDTVYARRVKLALLSQVADLCRTIEGAGLFHRDFKASNILVTDWASADGDPRLWFVDLDGIHRRRPYHWGVQWRSITRLAASVVDSQALNRTDFLRFLRTYLAARGAPADEWKPRWRQIEGAVVDYNRRSRARKRGKLDGWM